MQKRFLGKFGTIRDGSKCFFVDGFVTVVRKVSFNPWRVDVCRRRAPTLVSVSWDRGFSPGRGRDRRFPESRPVVSIKTGRLE